MKRIIIAITAILSIGMFSCNNNAGDPQSVLSQFFDAMAKKDITAARKLCTAESKSMLDMMDMQMKLDSSNNEMSKYDKNQVEFGQPVIEGDKASITVKPKNEGESLKFYLKKENKEWKVAFDKNSMIEMGMEKVKEKGMNVTDSVGKAFDEMKDVNMDSLKKGLKEGLKKLDSVKRLLKKEEIK